MLVIRLTRTGRKNLATYRVVAAEKARAAKGKYIANLGHYNPHTKDLELDKPAIAKYLENGAQPSSAVVKLFKKAKIKMPEWAEANLEVRKRAPKNQEEEAEVTETTEVPKKTPEEKPAEKAPKENKEATEAQPSTEESKDDSGAAEAPKEVEAKEDEKAPTKEEATDAKEAPKESKEEPKEAPEAQASTEEANNEAEDKTKV